MKIEIRKKRDIMMTGEFCYTHYCMLTEKSAIYVSDMWCHFNAMCGMDILSEKCFKICVNITEKL